MRTHFAVSVAALALAGCATVVKPPPAVSYELGSARATYRAYQKQSTLCAAEPRWLFDELASVNNLIDRFLDDTETRKDGSLSDVQILKLEDATQTLPDVLDVHEKNLALLGACAFATQRGFPVLVKRGREYAREARRRLEDAPGEIAAVKRKEALEEWRERVGHEKVTLQLGCPKRRARTPIIYFAWPDEQGVTPWLFCDGSKVTQESGSTPMFEASPLMSARELKRVKASRWLKAAKAHPRTGIMSPPSGSATADVKAW